MIRRILSGAAIGASMLAAPAQAGELLNDPMFYWQAQFGGVQEGSQRAGLGLRSSEASELPGAAVTVLGLETGASDFTVRVAGMPVAGSRYRLGQDEGEGAADAGGDGDPWYTQARTWWVAAGVAFSAVIIDDAKDDDALPATRPSSGTPNGPVCVTPDACLPDAGGVPDPGVPDVPALPVPFAGAAGDGSGAASRADWFDEGTGRMGDLIAR